MPQNVSKTRSSPFPNARGYAFGKRTFGDDIVDIRHISHAVKASLAEFCAVAEKNEATAPFKHFSSECSLSRSSVGHFSHVGESTTGKEQDVSRDGGNEMLCLCADKRKGVDHHLSAGGKVFDARFGKRDRGARAACDADDVFFVFEKWDEEGGDQTLKLKFPWLKHLFKTALAYGSGF